MSFLKNDNMLIRGQLDEKLRGEIGKFITGNCPHVDTTEDISASKFVEKYVDAKRPVVLKGLAKDWPAINKWNPDFFSDNYGDTKVVYNLYDVNNVQRSTLKDFFVEYGKKDTEIPAYLQEWWFLAFHGELADDIEIPEHFALDQNKKLLGFNNSTLWLGPDKSYTPVHQDTTFTNIWTTQIRGNKEWLLFDPSSELLANEDGDPDYENFVSQNEGKIFHCVLEPGDILYVPFRWWHRASAIGDSFSMNTFYISDDIVSRYLRDVFKIILAQGLNKDVLTKYDPSRYNICCQRSEIISRLMGFDLSNILGVDLSGSAVGGLYAHRKKEKEIA